jgi:hypothetical protein
MTTAFLLRFQENCSPDDPPDIPSGTQTSTRMQAEQPDIDCPHSGYHVLSHVPAKAFDPTRTLIRAEAPDDTAEGGMTVLPRRASAAGPTMTATYVRAEANDNDPGPRSMYAIPKCS